MGTLAGHVLPGSFFIAISIWWTWMIGRRRRSAYSYLDKAPHAFRSTPTYDIGGPRRRVCVEGWFKVTAASLGIAGELYTGLRNGQVTSFGNLQHSSMYLLFGCSGVFDLLIHYRLFRIILHPDIRYICMIIGCANEAILFWFHLHGRSHLDVMLHTLLVFVVVTSCIIVMIEMTHRHSYLAALGRPFITFIHGTWFCTVGAVLHTPWGQAHFEPHNHDDMMTATCMFALHIPACGAILFSILAATSCCASADTGYVTCNGSDSSRTLIKSKRSELISNEGSNPDRILPLDMYDSISESERGHG